MRSNDLSQETNAFLTTDRNGVKCSALGLNGSFIKLSEDVYFNSSFTISVWIYPDQAGHYARVIDFGNGVETDNVVLSFTGNYNLKPYFYVTGPTSGGSMKAFSDIALVQNKWSFLVATYNGTHGNIYINGEKTGTSNNLFFFPGNIVRKSNFIGKSNWQRDEYSYSIIDDLRIYNRYLDDSEINYLMNL